MITVFVLMQVAKSSQKPSKWNVSIIFKERLPLWYTPAITFERQGETCERTINLQFVHVCVNIEPLPDFNLFKYSVGLLIICVQ